MSDGSFLGTTGGREMLPSEVDAQSTHATGWVNNERQFMPLLDTFHSGGGPHAEDKLKQFIETHNIRDTVLCVYLTKSPCTCTELNGCPATGKGCAEMLEALARERNLKFQFLVRNFYQPAISGADRASIEAVKWLHATGNFAFSVDKAPRSNTGKLLQQGFVNILQGQTDSDGFFVMQAPSNNDFVEEFG